MKYNTLCVKYGSVRVARKLDLSLEQLDVLKRAEAPDTAFSEPDFVNTWFVRDAVH